MVLIAQSIGVVAPGRAVTRDTAAKVEALCHALYGDAVRIVFHDQCFLNAGHFAGDDKARGAAFREFANDPDIDAIWFARGGYGACRLHDDAFTGLTEPARNKLYLGYSDAGAMLARLYGAGVGAVAHGPMPADILRDDGEKAVERALRYIVERDAGAIEENVRAGRKDTPFAAFNITMLAHLAGTPWLPDLAGHVLLLEDVGEYHYRIDRAMFAITQNPSFSAAAGVRLGRCSEIPENDIAFGGNEEEIVRDWCSRAGVAFLGRANIGHDTENRVVPFGVKPAGDTASLTT